VIKRSLVFILLAAGSLVPAAGAFAQAAPPSLGTIGVRLLEAPVARQNDPRARDYIVDHLSQGTTISRRMEVVNRTTEPQTIQLYAGAAKIADGLFSTLDGHTGNELSTWTSVAPGLLSIPPGQSAQATVTIAVPKDAHDGERYGAVWAERVASTQQGVNVANRVGIRMYLSVGTGSEPASDFTIETLTAKRLPGGDPAVTAMVHNTGGRALDMSGNLELKDGPGGLHAGPFNAELGTTLGIGQREPVLVKLDRRIPAGPWDAVITLKSGEIAHSAHATITFPASGSGRAVKANSLGDKVKILLPLAGILLAILVAFVIALRRRRKDEYKQIKADLRRFEKLVKAHGGVELPVSRADDPAIAIRAAIKQAKRSGDEKTAAKLEARLDELVALRAASARAAEEPETAAVPPLAQEAEPAVETGPAAAEPALEAEFAPAPVAEAEVGGDVPPASPPPAPVPEARAEPSAPSPERTAATVLRELAAAAPGARRFALIREARAFGIDIIEAHPDELSALSDDLRARVMSAPPGAGNGNGHSNGGIPQHEPEGSEIA
jgi:hypothetical protein